MNATLSACAYLIEEIDSPISFLKVNYIMYLCDWKCAIMYRKSITNSNWLNSSIGPYSKEIFSTIMSNKNIFSITSLDGGDVLTSEVRVIPANEFWKNNLKAFEIDIINFTISKTKDLTYSSFISLINSTFPVIRSEDEDILDLLKSAKKYPSSSLWDDSANRL